MEHFFISVHIVPCRTWFGASPNSVDVNAHAYNSFSLFSWLIINFSRSRLHCCNACLCPTVWAACKAFSVFLHFLSRSTLLFGCFRSTMGSFSLSPYLKPSLSLSLLFNWFRDGGRLIICQTHSKTMKDEKKMEYDRVHVYYHTLWYSLVSRNVLKKGTILNSQSLHSFTFPVNSKICQPFNYS